MCLWMTPSNYHLAALHWQHSATHAVHRSSPRPSTSHRFPIDPLPRLSCLAWHTTTANAFWANGPVPVLSNGASSTHQRSNSSHPPTNCANTANANGELHLATECSGRRHNTTQLQEGKGLNCTWSKRIYRWALLLYAAYALRHIYEPTTIGNWISAVVSSVRPSDAVQSIIF